MTTRDIYLAKYRLSANQRAHFAIFVPDGSNDGKGLSRLFKSAPCKGTIINVVGEPVMSGYVLEIKRGYDCSAYHDLRELIALGPVDKSILYIPTEEHVVEGDTPRGLLEQEAEKIPPPPRGQNVRAPIDGVSIPLHIYLSTMPGPKQLRLTLDDAKSGLRNISEGLSIKDSSALGVLTLSPAIEIHPLMVYLDIRGQPRCTKYLQPTILAPKSIGMGSKSHRIVFFSSNKFVSASSSYLYAFVDGFNI